MVPRTLEVGSKGLNPDSITCCLCDLKEVTQPLSGVFVCLFAFGFVFLSIEENNNNTNPVMQR